MTGRKVLHVSSKGGHNLKINYISGKHIVFEGLPFFSQSFPAVSKPSPGVCHKYAHFPLDFCPDVL